MSRLIPESMEINHKISIEKIKTHVREKKSSYISGAAGIGIGAVAVLVLRKPTIINSVAPVISPVFNNDNSSVVNFGGHATKIVQRASDGKIWAKAKHAAREISETHGITEESARTMLSRHTNGSLPDVFGEQYRTIGLSTVG